MPEDSPVIRPGAILLTLVLMGISTLFIGLSAAYLYSVFSSGSEAPQPPLVFIANIPVLMLATRAIGRSLPEFETSNYAGMRRLLWVAIGCTVIFIVVQVIGWVWFFGRTDFLSSQLTGFLFVLSATHLAHVLGGLPFLGSFIFRARDDSQIPLRTRTYWTGYLKGIARYWKFLDVLWILLVAVLWAGVLITMYI